MSAFDRSRLEETLGRIDDLIAALSHIPDPVGRETARALTEVVLDLHGLALARIMAMAAAAEGGRTLLDSLARDEQVKAVLLLHGLHPDDVGTRIRNALDGLRPRLNEAGVEIAATRLSARAVSLQVAGAMVAADTLRREIEHAVINAAPEIDEVIFETGAHEASLGAPALAG